MGGIVLLEVKFLNVDIYVNCFDNLCRESVSYVLGHHHYGLLLNLMYHMSKFILYAMHNHYRLKCFNLTLYERSRDLS